MSAEGPPNDAPDAPAVFSVARVGLLVTLVALASYAVGYSSATSLAATHHATATVQTTPAAAPSTGANGLRKPLDIPSHVRLTKHNWAAPQPVATMAQVEAPVEAPLVLSAAAAVFGVGLLLVGSLRWGPTARTAELTWVTAATGGSPSAKKRVLFVCLGNICRSPTAEAVFQAAVDKAGAADQFVIDSCGTGGGSPDWYRPGGFSYHEGNTSDARMMKAASARGVRLTSRSRPLQPRDLAEFDHIIGMDAANIAAIKEAAEYWHSNGQQQMVPADYAAKLALMTDFLTNPDLKKRYSAVPDPYFGGSEGFETVLDLLGDACAGLLRNLRGSA